MAFSPPFGTKNMLLEKLVFGSKIQFGNVFCIILPAELIVPTFDKCIFFSAARALLVLLQ